MLTLARAAALIFLVPVAAPPALAEVESADASGFALRNEVSIDAGREAVYRAFVGEVGRWWNPDHTLSGNSAALFMDARPMGCLCEATGGDGGMVHMVVTLAAPPTLLRLTGGLGPLGLEGVSGNLTVEFDETDAERTRVELRYVVGGYTEDGLDTIAPAVDRVLDDLLTRLAAWVEHGDPEQERAGP